MPEIVDRVAAMVDYTLDTIVGPKSKNLKVKDPKKYAFEPKTLLSEFIDIYLNLGVSERFIEAVARDGRSYKPENFNNASRILSRFSIRSNEDLAAFEALKERFKIAKEIDDQDEGDLGEIPDEFEDPILATLMEDPVILPISQQTVDRNLKERIIKWKAEKREQAKNARATATAEKMDVTEG
ncbi:putative Ubiquitin conjugation factor E4 [Glarea lozoyensis 74030]|uniref:peptidylprolyl isomerase n=1 Tax=Glarea lozoyensis (strain ATCC 74030 / MF5533) TaxID=1104152 RepID=H0EQN5_GLAL7|nr:putative Ubiquitin conjugation factor E4 [Glarea lozoyensis 74030]